jgi:uncharacterized protein YlxP (DUF503 family)
MKINKARSIINRFNVTREKTKFNISFNKIDATTKWVEYSLDLVEIKSLMKNEDFITRCELENTLKKVENKINWMYKHPNFDLTEASREFKRAKKLLNL